MSVPAKAMSLLASPLFQMSDESPPQTYSLDAFLCMQVDAQLFTSALKELNLALARLSELKATRVSRALLLFLARHSEFHSLLCRITRNGWLSLTETEKQERKTIRRQTAELKSEKALLNDGQIHESISKKFFKAHRLKQPIGLSQCELLWISRNPMEARIFNIRSRFLLPSPSSRFDYSDSAYSALAMRLRVGLLTPDDKEILSQYGVPVSDLGIVSLDDAQWVKNPYAKAVLYSIIKSRRSESKQHSSKRLVADGLQKFKRIALSDESSTVEPAMHVESSSKDLSHTPKNAPKLKRIELDSDNEPSDYPSPSKGSFFNRVKSVVLSVLFF